MDLRSFREAAFRAIHVERFARHLLVLVKESFDHASEESGALDRVVAAREGIAKELGRLGTVVPRRSVLHVTSPGSLNRETLSDWRHTWQEVERYLARASALVQEDQKPEAQRVLIDELDVLLRERLLPPMDRVIQSEAERLDEYSVRAARADDHWSLVLARALDLRGELLPGVFKRVLTERFARHAYAELTGYAHPMSTGRPLDPLMLGSLGDRASRTLDRLTSLENAKREGGDGLETDTLSELAEIYSEMRSDYAQLLALPIASRGHQGKVLMDHLEASFDNRILPRIEIAATTDELLVERQMAYLDALASGILVVGIGMAVLTLMLVIGTPYLALRLLVSPIRELTRSIQEFTDRKEQSRLELRRSDELGDLSRALNALTVKLEESSQKVRALAFYDTTTGLANRRMFLERLREDLTAAQADGRTLGLLSLGLDGFRNINETLGHEIGDEALRQVARRLRECVRLSDVVARPAAKGGTVQVSRVGDGEFTISLTKMSAGEDASVVADRILRRFTEPFYLDDEEVVLRACIGIALFPLDGSDAETLLKNVTTAMRHAKSRGGNHYQFCSELMNESASRKLRLRSRLGGALERQELTLHYQPVRDTRTGRISGAEVLLRWHDPEMGLVPPSEFIPIAEETGLIVPIGKWVVRAACEQAKEWQDQGFRPIRIAVNVSVHQLSDGAWAENVFAILQETGLSSKNLELEITETVIMRDDPAIMSTFASLEQGGLSIVLDDFGTGYSSLSYLRRFPIHGVKIDRSFVSEITQNDEDAAITMAILAMARSLNLRVVAEGVETEEQATFLRARGCDELQGYLISRPVPPEEFQRFLDPEKPDEDTF
jgi:diguanylate cyclase (GGDEF)-like protein